MSIIYVCIIYSFGGFIEILILNKTFVLVIYRTSIIKNFVERVMSPWATNIIIKRVTFY